MNGQKTEMKISQGTLALCPWEGTEVIKQSAALSSGVSPLACGSQGNRMSRSSQVPLYHSDDISWVYRRRAVYL